MPVFVEGRKVYVNTDGTQTVKICTAENRRTIYEKYYRIYPPYTLVQRTMEAEIGRFCSIGDLEAWLRDLQAVREQQNETVPVTPTPPPQPPTEGKFDIDDDPVVNSETQDVLAEILDLVQPTAYFPDNDSWLVGVREKVEQAINTLVKEFVDSPYLHRVEHSIHAHLFNLITLADEFGQHYPIGKNLATTQLVHKEWPETIPRPEKGNRRGNFDIAILSPSLLTTCPSIDVFLDGKLPAPIVIEIGLDYDGQHLANDAKKLINSKPKYGYLIHLVRDVPRDPMVEQIILGIESKVGIRTAYARVTNGRKEYKLVTETKIIEV